VTNLAIEGFQGVGAFFGALAATVLAPLMGNGNQIIIYIAILCAAIGGALFSCIHGLLCIRFRANQVISGVVINILAVALTAFFTSAANTAISGSASNKFILDVSARFSIPLLSRIPWIGGLFTNMYPFEIVIIVLVIVLWYLLNRTRFGMRLRACGENPQAVDAAGADVIRIRWVGVIISGALAGIVGLFLAGGIEHTIATDTAKNMGFTAIMATWLAAFNPLVMMGTCFFIIFISRGMVEVRADFGFTNDSIANIVIGLVYFCVIACSFFITYRVVFRKASAKTAEGNEAKGEKKE
jgi:simple sugar transport system permease protein